MHADRNRATATAATSLRARRAGQDIPPRKEHTVHAAHRRVLPRHRRPRPLPVAAPLLHRARARRGSGRDRHPHGARQDRLRAARAARTPCAPGPAAAHRLRRRPPRHRRPDGRGGAHLDDAHRRAARPCPRVRCLCGPSGRASGRARGAARGPGRRRCVAPRPGPARGARRHRGHGGVAAPVLGLRRRALASRDARGAPRARRHGAARRGAPGTGVRRAAARHRTASGRS